MIECFRRVVAYAVFCLLALGALAAPRVTHVFIISIDGGKPAVIQQSAMPVLANLVVEGAHTWVANTIFPSTTLPAHTSMLTGVGPDKHKVLWNDWKPDAGVVRVPTVFSEAKAAGFSTAMFVGKEKFRQLVQSNSVDEFSYDRAKAHEVTKTENGVTNLVKEDAIFFEAVAWDAAAYIARMKPNLCFIHFTETDSMGHEFGWGSAQQIAAFETTDKAIGVVLKAIREAGIGGDSVLIITADHGGHGRGHGTRSLEDMHIPWVAWGKGVKRHFEITEPVTTCDTAATALWLLGVNYPASLDGHPVTSAFE